MGTRLPQVLSLQRHNPKALGEPHTPNITGCVQIAPSVHAGSWLVTQIKAPYSPNLPVMEYGNRQKRQFFLSLTNMNKKHLVKDLSTAENASFTQLR